MYLLVSELGLNTKALENIANAISMEISVVYMFFLSRNWTWNDTQKFYGAKLLKQMISFHLAVGFSLLLRLILFPLIQVLGIHYIINTITGIGVGAIINYVLYDRIIFSLKKEVI